MGGEGLYLGLAGSRRAVPNNGGWYDFGYFIGVVFLGVGARKSASYTDRTTEIHHHMEHG